ncbi:Methyl farnesoate epoxidase [Folsomia candida]|uniref:Methyl farnesoate epoxidase n=2 Tax=Folsomia candida TaxID=158441 RepID=A0A226DL17_FOLCA|nr:Methyl farnesoate epoxidase [Folsomia candida]
MIVAVVNSLWMIMSGHRYNHDDPKILAFSEQLTEVLELAAEGGGIVLFWPWLEKLGYKGFTAFRNYTDRMKNLFTQTVQEHKETCVTDFSRDFIDVFIKEINTCEDPGSAFFKDVGERQLVAVLKDLFEAGAETTSASFSWVFLYMATFPDVQRKFQKQIDDVVGTSRFCSLSDRAR